MSPSKTVSAGSRPGANIDFSASEGRQRPGRAPEPIIEHPEPLFTDWIAPSCFHEALSLHMRRHGDSYWKLSRAIVKPGEKFSRHTVQSWGKGDRVPRSLDSFEMLSRIEQRYRLPNGYFRGLLPHQTRAPSGHKLDGIVPAEQRRLAWHLPDDFNDRPAKEREEIVAWVRQHILFGSTDYRRYQAEAMKHRYAIRFPALTSRRPTKSLVQEGEDIDPDTLSVAMDAPPGLAREMAELVAFKTATLTMIGFRRNGVWGEETSAQKIEHLGLMFGALAASPKGKVAGFGVPSADLSFGLLIFPTVWDWYVQWRERRRGFYTGWESEMLRLIGSLTREETGWMRQTPGLAHRLSPVANLVSAADIERVQADWPAACEVMHAHALARARAFSTAPESRRVSSCGCF